VVFCSHPWLFGRGLAHACDLRSKERRKFWEARRPLHSPALSLTASSASACLSPAPPAVVATVTCGSPEERTTALQTLHGGKIIPAGQQTNKMKEMSGIVWDGETSCDREASTQRPRLVHRPSLVEAGRLAGVAGDGRFPFEET